jgi:F0F1-type ATP synthase membrane subunit b/b'
VKCLKRILGTFSQKKEKIEEELPRKKARTYEDIKKIRDDLRKKLNRKRRF